MAKQEMEKTTAALPSLAPEETRELLRAAIDQGGAEAIERIAALYERAQERASARAYHAALAQFAAAMKPLAKTRTANITGRSGSSYSYSYTPLEDIARTIKGPLEAAGLSYTWDSAVADGYITVTCTVRHIEGHAESAQFTCPTESSGGMSAQQKVAAALTFGRRQSLVQVLGLTSCDDDNDGADAEVVESITEAQAADLELLIENVGADKTRFLKWAGVERVADISRSRYSAAVRLLEEKGRGQ